MFLEANHVVKNFGDFRALDDVSLQIHEGAIFGLLGPNGAGKSTLIRIINRILRADQGEVLLNGRLMQDDDVLQIGYLPEERGLYKKMKVGEQAIYLAQLKGLSRREATRRLQEWFDKFEISGWWNRRVEELSKGMQQKVQFIVTVLHRPRLLIFDEPFSGFDPVNAELLKREMLELRRQGATIIFSTHNMESVEELCDEIALVNHSHVVLSGNVQEIRAGYRQNRFRVQYLSESTAPLVLPDDYKIVSGDGEGALQTLQVVLPQGCTANDLLAHLLPQCQVQSLHELLPTMKDIFISTVSDQ